jgi:hypothetical protein
MFAKLGMSVKDAFEEFNKISNKVYLVDMKPERRTATLRKCVEDLLKRRGLPIDLVMGKDKRGPPSKCLWYVLNIADYLWYSRMVALSLQCQLPICTIRSSCARILHGLGRR